MWSRRGLATLGRPSPEHSQSRERFGHVLVPVPLADDGVELEFYVVAAAPLGDAEQLLDVLHRLAVVGPTNLHVDVFVEGIARDAEDVDIFGILLEESLVDEAAV